MSLAARADASSGRPEMVTGSRGSMGDASLIPGGDASPGAALDAPAVVEVLPRLCSWCRLRPLEVTQDKWCSKKCRQTAYRFRRLSVVEGLGDDPKRLGYADPPYVGMSKKYYGDEPTYRGEVDHVALVRKLVTEYDGWALSCSQESLPYVLSLIPSWVKVEVCPWVKVIHRSDGRGPLSIHEYVVAVPARRRFPGVPDALVCAPERGGDSSLIGRKPITFVNWVFRILGAIPVDNLDDMYPGSGIVGRCWEEFRRTAPTVNVEGVIR